ncbi:MAG: hypothetical protein IKP71_13100 [Candidatus Riflebacteria bacterium]|nr:hypothetical protein [Candidatus Riflebacteria bacterium]
MEFIQQFLADCKIENKARIKALLVVEEALGRIGVKILSLYFFTTLIAVGIGVGTVVVTSIVAKSEDQMNMEVYRQ